MKRFHSFGPTLLAGMFRIMLLKLTVFCAAGMAGCAQVEEAPACPPASHADPRQVELDQLEAARTVLRGLCPLWVKVQDSRRHARLRDRRPDEFADLARCAVVWIAPRFRILRGHYRWDPEFVGYPADSSDVPGPDEVELCIQELAHGDLNQEALAERDRWSGIVDAIRGGRFLESWPWEEAEERALARKLDGVFLDLDFSDSTLYDIVDYIQEFARINIVISAEVRKAGIPDRKIDFHAASEPIGTTLRRLCDRYGLAWRLANRVLLIVAK
ncbi:MAG: hypothetical protein AAB074_19715 [Planctomycetota bacterium]